mmetsp:Transcript_28578/g.71643  ORF Transcript_28578/g.71643 Transcript_28578/m.71643 type:complete len:241 (+) Transcript_28578:1262-1984(+)
MSGGAMWSRLTGLGIGTEAGNTEATCACLCASAAAASFASRRSAACSRLSLRMCSCSRNCRSVPVMGLPSSSSRFCDIRMMLSLYFWMWQMGLSVRSSEVSIGSCPSTASSPSTLSCSRRLPPSEAMRSSRSTASGVTSAIPQREALSTRRLRDSASIELRVNSRLVPSGSRWSEMCSSSRCISPSSPSTRAMALLSTYSLARFLMEPRPERSVSWLFCRYTCVSRVQASRCSMRTSRLS